MIPNPPPLGRCLFGVSNSPNRSSRAAFSWPGSNPISADPPLSIPIVLAP